MRACLGRAQVGGARISWTRAREMHASLGACKLGRMYLLGARMSWILLLHKEMYASGAPCCALLCNVDAGVRAQKMQASGPRRCRRLGLNVCLLAVQWILGCVHVSWLLL